MKNIVICCDGTNNQLSTDPTNVLRLYNSLDLRDPTKQIGFYDPGVGTLATPGLINPIAQQLSLVYGLAFGVGFTRNLEESYRFLMHNWEPGDRIYLFGFSRGAFTVRALAGMVRMFGLLKLENENLLPYLSRGYDSQSVNTELKNRVKPFVRGPIPFEFLGLWDSVSSLGFTYTRVALPFTANNAQVRVIRQALAIDERRAYFRQNMWGKKDAAIQNVKQVWFAGVHSDVGGGYPEEEDTLSKIPFEWIVEEANNFGLLINRAAYKQQLYGTNGKLGPDIGGKRHESLEGGWWVLEYVPKNKTLDREDLYLPRGAPRDLPGHKNQYEVVLHQSVVERMNAPGSEYDPQNVPKDYKIEPWSTRPPEKKSTPVGPTLGFWGHVSPFLWVGGFYYALFAVLHLLFQIGVWLIDQFILDEPKSNWVFSVYQSLFWPPSLYTWSLVPHNWLVAGVFLVPLAVLIGGGELINWWSGLAEVRSRVKGKLLHLLWTGYDSDLAQKQFEALKLVPKPDKAPAPKQADAKAPKPEEKKEPELDGLAAYRRALKMDLAFPIFYGLALAWALYAAYQLDQFTAHWLAMLVYPWILALPVVPVVADWIENAILIAQLNRFEAYEPQPNVKNEPLSKTAIAIASFATKVKLIGVSLTFFVILILLLLHAERYIE